MSQPLVGQLSHQENRCMEMTILAGAIIVSSTLKKISNFCMAVAVPFPFRDSGFCVFHKPLRGGEREERESCEVNRGQTQEHAQYTRTRSPAAKISRAKI